MSGLTDPQLAREFRKLIFTLGKFKHRPELFKQTFIDMIGPSFKGVSLDQIIPFAQERIRNNVGATGLGLEHVREMLMSQGQMPPRDYAKRIFDSEYARLSRLREAVQNIRRKDLLARRTEKALQKHKFKPPTKPKQLQFNF